MEGYQSISSLAVSNTLIDTVIFDLGDVLFTWSDSTPQSPLPPKVVKGILRSSTWFEYEKGKFTEQEAYDQVATDFGVSASEVKGAFRAARESLQSDRKLLDFIRTLKESGMKIYGMSNISAPDWEFMQTRADLSDWALFDRVFASALAGERKPNLGFYNHVIKETGLDATKTAFVDDKIENVLTARSTGMQGIVFTNASDVIRQLRNLREDPIQRANQFLQDNKRKMLTVSSPDGVPVEENFSQLLILELTGDGTLVDYVKYEGRFNFFKGEGKLIMTTTFPDDLDTTSIGLTIAPYIKDDIRHQVMDEMLNYVNDDGIIQTYFDHTRPRIDPVVCCNVLTLFYRNGRGHELGKTLEWIETVLIHSACSYGSLYYASEDQFLFFLSRLLQSSTRVYQRLGHIFAQSVANRFGTEADPLGLAMRIYAGAVVGLVASVDLERLLTMQHEDGSWKGGVYYRFPTASQVACNDGMTTALAIQAIESAKKLKRQGLGI
ncbi:HAD-like protein [Dendrothele bispora CBS 962.96]|uniref:HAD-like protein n=1 Tax=Dendrothele bispora (strain CBS 962.96) TaxID=1314807 RepID=A0A4S8MBA0_DENBC|nr:HAD-like protein [Dendrothele bispora CBS 962.96]